MQKTKSILSLLLFACLALSNTASAVTFKFNYDTKYNQYWNADVKAQIQEAGRFLADYIADAHEITINVTVDPNLPHNVYAVGAPSGWKENTTTKSVANQGGIAFSSNTLGNVKDKSIVALTIHELLHCLGFSNPAAKAFTAHTSGYNFTGPRARAVNGGHNVSLDSDKSHFPWGTQDPKGVEPRMCNGGGHAISAIDLAVLSDIGYTVPVVAAASAPMFVGVTLNALHGIMIGTKTMIPGMGGNDVLYAGSGETILCGMGGNDVLVSGDGPTEMTGDNQPPFNVMGTDGSDIFYIKSNTGIHRVTDLDPTDKIYLSPAVGVTKAQIEAAMQDPSKFYDMPVPGCEICFVPGEWLLDMGAFKLGIGTKNKQKPTNANQIEIRNWSK